MTYAQRRQDLVSQPPPQSPVLRDVMVNQQREQRRLADKELFAPPAIALEPGDAVLIRVEFAKGAFVESFAHEAGGVCEAEPGLMIELEGAELAVVADEELGFEAVGHCLISRGGESCTS